jgi:predicted permease
MTWWNRFRRRERLDEDLDKELRFHVEQYTDDLVANGHSHQQARREARLALGGPEQLKEDCRDARGTRWLEDLWHDFRYALRTLGQRPGFAAVALLTLALGTGANTVMFTLINSVLLKPLAYPEPEKLVTVGAATVQFGRNNPVLSYPDYLDLKRDTHAFEQLAAWSYGGGGTITSPGEPEWLMGREISSDIFRALRIPLEQGRAFLPDEDRRGGAPVTIISHRLWQRRFGESAAAVGQRIIFDGAARTIVGIAPAGFQLGAESDVFTPLGQDTAPRMNNREASFLPVIGRLRKGADVAQAQTELTALGHGLAAQYPISNTDRSFNASPLRQGMVNGVQSTLWLLLGAVGLVLVMACVNVASLLLARAVSREREVALRVALGAGRGRLIRQCLTESALLGIGGGCLGLAIAAAGIRPFVLLWPDGLPRAEEVRLDWHVLLFAFAVSVLSGLLFGLAPALRAPARQVEQTLRAGARSVTGGSRRLHGAFVGLQIALAVVLLVSAGLLARTMLRLSSLDPGINLHNVLAARVSISPTLLSDPVRTRAAWLDLLDHARRAPGVQAAALTDIVPMRQGGNALDYWTSPDMPPLNRRFIALATSTTPDHWTTLGIPLRSGRLINDYDRMGGEAVVVIDDVLARHAFKGADAVGKELWVPALAPGGVRVIAVVGHVRNFGLAGDDASQIRDQLYYPFAQVPDGLMRLFSGFMSIVVRTSVPPLNEIEPLRKAVRGASGDQVLYDTFTMEQLASASLARQRFLLLLFGVFAGLALLLACVGIYGVLAYLTSQRVPEIGVRMALGATGGSVMKMVLRQSLGMIASGALLGVGAGIAAARLLQRLVAGVQAVDPLTITLMIAVLAAAALAASFAPARRASHVDPMNALRND